MERDKEVALAFLEIVGRRRAIRYIETHLAKEIVIPSITGRPPLAAAIRVQGEAGTLHSRKLWFLGNDGSVTTTGTEKFTIIQESPFTAIEQITITHQNVASKAPGP
ncbi:hypothetical protein KM043_004181 [Ampulex compressa]|nr:hypothetical protein KM043_004181 [Ampulex compressa]